MNYDTKPAPSYMLVLCYLLSVSRIFDTAMN